MTELQKRQCMTCALQQRSLNDGLICSLTQEKPKYETKCSDRKRSAKEEASFLELFTTKNSSLHIQFALPQPPEFITQDPTIIGRSNAFSRMVNFCILAAIPIFATIHLFNDDKESVEIKIIMICVSVITTIIAYIQLRKGKNERPFVTLSLKKGLTFHNKYRAVADKLISWDDLLCCSIYSTNKQRKLMIHLLTHELPIEIDLAAIDKRDGLILNKIEAFKRRYHQIHEA